MPGSISDRPVGCSVGCSVGHSGTSVTELVYRHQIRPVIQTGATAMDRLFNRDSAGA